MAETAPRGKRRLEVGVVTSDKMNKTRRVEIPRLVKHPRYGKYIRRRTICYVHDEQNASHTGDTVEIMETRPLSPLQRPIRSLLRRTPEPVGGLCNDPDVYVALCGGQHRRQRGDVYQG